MKKNEKISLDSISNIDEKIIDEVTDKKLSLLRKLGGTTKHLRKRLIAIGGIAACFILMFSVLLVIIIPMLGSNVPVYQGMTIRHTSPLVMWEDTLSDNGVTLLSASGNSGAVFLSNSNGNGNAYGHDKDNHKDKDDKPKNDIEDIVVIDVKTDDEVRYYVKPGETFIIEIHIDNPRDYEIQSFTLNGDKYANYMFKEGSTMELLLLEVTAPNEPGYVEYTIDAIKYIDGTEIKDVDMSSGDKSIKAGIAYPVAPSATVLSQSILPTSIALSVNVTDPYALIGENELAVYLTDGERMIGSKPLTVGVNNITFDNLSMNKTYEYGIVTAYDLVDGKDLHKEWLLTSTITTAGAFGISHATPTQDSISFEIEKIGAVGEITSISLFDAETDDHVASGGADIREFTGLLSNHAYNLYVDFKYTLDGEEITDWVAIKGIKTVAKSEPVLTFGDESVDQTSISYDVSTSDPDGILNIASVELLKNGQPIKNNGTALNGKFEGLLSNNAYTVRVTYTYDLNDGQGVHTKTVTKDIKTVAKTAPAITFDDPSITDTSVAGSYHMADPDAIGSVTLVEVRKNGTIIQSNAQYEIAFEGLEYYTDYSIAVIYTFDLNDGAGLQTRTATCDFKTAPHLVFESCKIANATAVSEGETIYLQIVLDNPSGALPESVEINGRSYRCTNATTATKIFAEIVCDGQFGGGDTVLTVEKVHMTLDGKSYAIEPTANNSASIFINSKLDLEQVDIVALVNGRYVTKDYFYPSDEVYMRIQLSNKTGYTVDSITISSAPAAEADRGSLKDTPLIKLSDECYVMRLLTSSNASLTTGSERFCITKITYHNEYLTKSADVNVCSKIVYFLKSDDIKEIRTADDLLDMDDGYYYILQNDIDLAGRSWLGNTFSGVFEGNGYTIKNMTCTGTVTTRFLGLFSSGAGSIQNLTLASVLFLVKPEGYYELYVGGFCGSSEGMSFINCEIDENSIISASKGIMVGGFVGQLETGRFLNCTNHASVTGDSNIGGFLGGICDGDFSFLESNPVNFIFENCKNTGSVSGNSNIGGFAGKISRAIFEKCENTGSVSDNGSVEQGIGSVGGIAGNGSDNRFEKCENTGTVSGNISVGGIAADGSNSSFKNCENTGTVSGKEHVGGITGSGFAANFENCKNTGSVGGNTQVGGIAGWGYGNFENCIHITSNIQPIIGEEYIQTPILTNCYTLGDNVTAEQLNSKDFYINTLGWSEEIWNFDDLDVENGKYPTLR